MDITEHGVRRTNSQMCRPIKNQMFASAYYHNLLSDYSELKQLYPFTKLLVPPTVQPREAKIVAIAVSGDLIKELQAKPEDFTEQYTKLIEVAIPYNYRTQGCNVYGGEWIDIKKFRVEDIHFMGRLDDGRFELCVGVPSSFTEMKNVILECVRTADNFLVAYEKYQRGLSKTLELITYSHGEAGVREYGKDKRRYRSN